jgi:toxin ParE1/3/4
VRRVSYSEAARRNLASILDYISRESGSRVVGQRFTGQLQEKCRKLASLPGILGRARPELRPDMRSFAFRGYVIFFRYGNKVLEIVNVLEGHLDIVAYYDDDDES